MPEQERSPVTGEAVDASALPRGYPSQVWTQDGESVVVATGKEGGCGHVRAEVVEQTESQVRLALIEETPEPPKMCTMDLRYPPVAARLDAPLDERRVVLEQRDVKVPA